MHDYLGLFRGAQQLVRSRCWLSAGVDWCVGVFQRFQFGNTRSVWLSLGGSIVGGASAGNVPGEFVAYLPASFRHTTLLSVLFVVCGDYLHDDGVGSVVVAFESP